MVKHFLKTLLFSLLVSCGNYISPEYTLNGNEKVLATYKLYSSWYGDNDFDSPQKDFKTAQEIKDLYDLYSEQYIRLYDNNKVILFSLPSNVYLNEYKPSSEGGSIGVYRKEKNLLYLKYKLGIGHGPKVVRSKAKIIEDTLHLIENVSKPRQHLLYVMVNDY